MVCSQMISPAAVATTAGAAGLALAAPVVAGVAVAGLLVAGSALAVAATVQAAADGALLFVDAARQAAAGLAPAPMSDRAPTFNCYQTPLADATTLRTGLQQALRRLPPDQPLAGLVLDLPPLRVATNNQTKQVRPAAGVVDAQGALRVVFTEGGPGGTLLAYAWGALGETLLREALVQYLGARLEQGLGPQGYQRTADSAAEVPDVVPAGSQISRAIFQQRSGGRLRRQVALAAQTVAAGVGQQRIDLHAVSNHTSAAVDCLPMTDILRLLGLSDAGIVVRHNPHTPLGGPSDSGGAGRAPARSAEQTVRDTRRQRGGA